MQLARGRLHCHCHGGRRAWLASLGDPGSGADGDGDGVLALAPRQGVVERPGPKGSSMTSLFVMMRAGSATRRVTLRLPSPWPRPWRPRSANVAPARLRVGSGCGPGSALRGGALASRCGWGAALGVAVGSAAALIMESIVRAGRALPVEG